MISTGIPSFPREPLVELPAPASGRREPVEFAYRTLDLLVAAAALIMLLPIMGLVAVAIRLDTPGPALFRQRRVGRGMKSFTVVKFRTMRRDASPDPHRRFVESLIAGHLPAPHAGGPRFKLADDERVTRVGHLLRRASLDELPQLWNVLLGEMSIVGPRPPIPYEAERYPATWLQRFAVKPGITGLWQVNGRCELTHEQMIALDLEYISRRSVVLNVWIILRTIPAVLSTRGAS